MANLQLNAFYLLLFVVYCLSNYFIASNTAGILLLVILQTDQPQYLSFLA